MKFSVSKFAACLFLLSSASALAVPQLQLDVIGGVWDPGTQTIVAQTPTFTLRVLLNGSVNSTTYYISAAVIPKGSSTFPSASFGPVVINGTSYSQGSFTFGTPPVDPSDPNIPSHGIFPAYYREFAFTFDAAHSVASYDTQTDASASGILYYHDFTVDATLLLDQALLAQGRYSDLYDIHFDLYDANHNFAPFSHDASSWYGVPDGASTLAMLGFGMVGILGFRRQLSRR